MYITNRDNIPESPGYGTDQTVEMQKELDEMDQRNSDLKNQLKELTVKLQVLEDNVDQEKQQADRAEYQLKNISSTSTEVATLQAALQQEITRVKNLWRTNCQQLGEFDVKISEKETEIQQLKSYIQKVEGKDTVAPVPDIPLAVSPDRHEISDGTTPPQSVPEKK